MSDLTVAEAADLLAGDLGLPVTLVPWTPPLIAASRPPAALRRALAHLDAHGGGLLVAHVVRDALGRRPTRADARDALAATLHDAPVAEVRALACADGVAVVAGVAAIPTPSLPADREPVEGTDATDLRASAASTVASLVTRRELADVDDDLGDHERVLVAAGALAVVDGELVPTVAGLVAFGRAPWERLGGLRVEVTDDGRERVVVGDGQTLPQRVVRALRVPEPNAEVIRALVERALIGRAWSAHPDDEPLVVRRRGHEVEVRWPASDTEEAPNPTLRRLLRAAGGLGRLAGDPARIGDRVAALGGEWFGEEVEDGDAVVRLALPEVDLSEPVEVPPPARPAVCRAEPERVPFARPVPVAATPTKVMQSPVSVVPRVTATAAPTPHVTANGREAAVLGLVDARGQVTTRDVIEGLGWTRSTTRDVIARMVATGRLTSVTASARSPFQAYVRSGAG